MSKLQIQLEYSSNFLNQRKKFLKNNPKRVEDYKKAVSLFVFTPDHPGLNTKKLSGVRGVFTFRLNKGYRVFFVWKNPSLALFIDIGTHDKYRKF